jgi:ectoine hydroxylase-related dioxygenase (phytanoyl-CoA dioxygenase family)
MRRKLAGTNSDGAAIDSSSPGDDVSSRAALLLSTRGYVKLAKAIPAELINSANIIFQDVLDDCMETRAEEEVRTISRKYGVLFWHRIGRYRIFPKLCGPLAEKNIIANPAAVGVLRKLLGEDFYCKFIASDTCLGTAILQSPHRDMPFYKTREPVCYVINVPLVDCRLDNGPLEIWPGGSHLWEEQLFDENGLSPFVEDGRNPGIERLLGEYYSEKIILAAGDILLRDPGMFHRGTPNMSGQPRPMLTIGVARRSFYYKYGNVKANLDRPSYELLDAETRKMFSYAFDPLTPFYWRMWFRTRVKTPVLFVIRRLRLLLRKLR